MKQMKYGSFSFQDEKDSLGSGKSRINKNESGESHISKNISIKTDKTYKDTVTESVGNVQMMKQTKQEGKESSKSKEQKRK